jgi:hypothetical protein
MWLFEFIIGILSFLLVAYYISLAAHIWEICKITDKEIKGKKILVPFYYWFN